MKYRILYPLSLMSILTLLFTEVSQEEKQADKVNNKSHSKYFPLLYLKTFLNLSPVMLVTTDICLCKKHAHPSCATRVNLPSQGFLYCSSVCDCEIGSFHDALPYYTIPMSTPFQCQYHFNINTSNSSVSTIPGLYHSNVNTIPMLKPFQYKYQ